MSAAFHRVFKRTTRKNLKRRSVAMGGQTDFRSAGKQRKRFEKGKRASRAGKKKKKEKEKLDAASIDRAVFNFASLRAFLFLSTFVLASRRCVNRTKKKATPFRLRECQMARSDGLFDTREKHKKSAYRTNEKLAQRRYRVISPLPRS